MKRQRMGDTVVTQAPRLVVSHQEAWQMVLGQLHSEMSRAHYETWVEPLRALDYRDRVFRLGAANPYARDWVEARLKSRIARLLEGLLNEPVAVQVLVTNGFYPPRAAAEAAPGQEAAPAGAAAPQAPGNDAEAAAGDARPAPAMDGEGGPAAVQPGGNGRRAGGQAEPQPSSRKLMLQRAYGTRR